MIEGACSVCRRAFKVDDRYAGMTGRCKACGAAIHVPGHLDEGLDGLPGAAPVAAKAPPAPAAAPEPAAPAPAPASAAPQAAQRQPPAEPAPPAPLEAQPATTQQVHPADELARHHDARARYEPSEGPTPLKGSWLREEEQAGAPQPTATPEPEAPAPQPTHAMLADRFITPPQPEPAAAQHRPTIVFVTCGVLCLLAVGFALHFGTAGRRGLAAAGLGLALAGLAVVRLWMAGWDGLLAGLLFCLCVAGSAMVDPQAFLANCILVGAAAIALLLLLSTLLRRSGRDYFTT